MTTKSKTLTKTATIGSDDASVSVFVSDDNGTPVWNVTVRLQLDDGTQEQLTGKLSDMLPGAGNVANRTEFRRLCNLIRDAGVTAMGWT